MSIRRLFIFKYMFRDLYCKNSIKCLVTFYMEYCVTKYDSRVEYRLKFLIKSISRIVFVYQNCYANNV